MKVLVIIPARGGSKGIPGKNLMMLGNQSLMQRAVDCAKLSKYNPDILVDSEDESILSMAEDLHVETHKRRNELATDNALVIDALLEAYDWICKKKKQHYDVLVLLQLTSPFRTTEQLDEIISKFNNKDVENVISVVHVEDIHPGRLYFLQDGKMNALDPQMETSPRQQLPPVYIRNGCFYAVRPEVMIIEKAIITRNKHAFVMDAKWWVNLDTPRDLAWAEFLLPSWQ